MIDTLETPVPVVAQIVGSSELFRGQIDGQTIVIQSNRGPVCRGRVDMGDMGYGSGNMRCSDGRFGSFSVDVKGNYGTAAGRLGRQDIKITIG